MPYGADAEYGQVAGVGGWLSKLILLTLFQYFFSIVCDILKSVSSIKARTSFTDFITPFSLALIKILMILLFQFFKSLATFLLFFHQLSAGYHQILRLRLLNLPLFQDSLTIVNIGSVCNFFYCYPIWQSPNSSATSFVTIKSTNVFEEFQIDQSCHRL